MLHEFLSSLPGIAALLTALGLIIANNRKSRAETSVIAGKVAADTAHSEAEIFEKKFNMLVSGLERRVADAEKEAADEREARIHIEDECRNLRELYMDCDKRLSKFAEGSK